ncbi:cupin domain-containing protein [Shewanella inventionis]|uniref:Transcriptional regulator n=1 Tax=Shewanella inventionis TaxID=1738770 RepID=A0ABQ1JFG1_9GAMM|nr:cupin domain-containing protein [Shewanella inventionis]MCL1158248.1 cupin domain-containing protein [Shewanella inventionis]GGB67132.1 transcriptional regulator [Shewanella inventionis]
MNKYISDITLFSGQSTEVESYYLADEKHITGNPLQSVQNHFESPCKQFNVGIWQSEAGSWNVNYSEYEYCDILEGSSMITDSQGKSLTVKAGDKFVIPVGFIGTWEVIEHCKKIYVMFEQQPAQT